MRKYILISAFLFFLAVAAYASFFVWKIYSTGEKITIIPKEDSSLLDKFESLISKKKLVKLKGEENSRINILLLGIAGKGKAGTNLTDTIMIASLDTKNNQVALLSIPRDFYAMIPDDKLQMKINSVYQYGLNKYRDSDRSVKVLESVISDMTSLPINYYAILNFDGFEKAIDAIGGINVMNERDIYDSRYPGPLFIRDLQT